MWGVRGRASPTPDRSSLGACCRAPLPTGCGCRVCWRGDLSPTPQRALLRAGFARCGGGTRAPGGGRLLPGPGASGVRRSPTPDRPSFGACGWGQHILAVGAGGVGVGTGHQPTARALAIWLCALWGRHEGARGGRLLPGCGASGVGRSPTPDRSSFEACGWGPLPTGCGCGGCGRGDQSETPPRALLRAGFARCRGGTRAPGGGASCLGVGCPGLGALPPPTARPLGRAAGAHYPLAVGAGGVGAGTCQQTHIARSCELALCAVGVTRGCPGRGGAPLACVWVVRGRASPTPDRSSLGACCRAPPPMPVGAGVAGVGTRHQPHSARSCELALRAVGTARGRSGWRLLAWTWGIRGRALSHPRPLVLLGRAAGSHYPLAVGAEGAGVGTRHQPAARAIASWLCALWGRQEGARGGRLLPWFGASRVGRSPTPDRSSFGACGQGPLPTGCRCGGCGREDPSPTPPRGLLRAALARCGGGTRAPGGCASCLGVGRPRLGALCGMRPGPTTHWLWVQGVWAWGRVTNPTVRAFASWLCTLLGRHCGAPGGRLLPGCGASGVGRSPTPDCPSFGACRRGPLPTGCPCGGYGRGDPASMPQRVLLQACFVLCEGGKRVPGGGASCQGVGRPGSGALPPPTARPLGRAAGAHYPPAVGALCGLWVLAVLGTFSCAAIRRVLCALPGFAAPGGYCGLAPVLVLWFWPAACLSGVPRGPALVRRASSGQVALGAPVGFPVAVVPFPTPGAVASGFTGWLRGACGGRPRTGLIVPAAAPAEAFRVKGRHARVPCVCVCACSSWLGRAGQPPGRVLVRPPLLSVAGLGALFVCSAPSALGLPCLRLLLGAFFFPFFFPAVSCVSCFLARVAFGLGVLWSSAPSPLFFFFFFRAPPCLLRSLVSGPGVPWALALCGPPAWPSSLLVFFSPPPPPPLLFFLFFCFSSLFSASAFLWFFFPCPGVPVVRFPGWFVCPGLRGVLVCVAVSLGAPWLCPFCVCCCLSGVVVCFVLCLVLCGVPVSGLVLAPRCCPLLPSPGPLPWHVVVFCPWVRCCIALVCRLSFGVLLWCRVVRFALAGAVWCCLWLLAVVSRWCVLSPWVLPGRVACCPAVCYGLLWCPAPLCCVLCSVVLCCRVVPCCGAPLCVLLCWW